MYKFDGRPVHASRSWSVERSTDDDDVVVDEKSGELASRRRSVSGSPLASSVSATLCDPAAHVLRRRMMP